MSEIDLESASTDSNSSINLINKKDKKQKHLIWISLTINLLLIIATIVLSIYTGKYLKSNKHSNSINALLHELNIPEIITSNEAFQDIISKLDLNKELIYHSKFAQKNIIVGEQNGQICKLSAMNNLVSSLKYNYSNSNNENEFINCLNLKNNEHKNLWKDLIIDNSDDNNVKNDISKLTTQRFVPIAKKYGSIQGEMQSINDIKNIFINELGFDKHLTESYKAKNKRDYIEQLKKYIDDNRLVIIYYAVEWPRDLPRAGLPGNDINLEHAAMVFGYIEFGDIMDTLFFTAHWGKRYLFSGSELFDSTNVLHSGNRNEKYIINGVELQSKQIGSLRNTMVTTKLNNQQLTCLNEL